jgi:phospholipase/carboxylesterase
VTRELAFGRQAARSGRARSLVVFVHGYGANGADLLGLAEPLAPHLPDTVFVAPDAPERCRGNPFGFQWFPVSWLDGSPPEAATRGLAASAGDLNAFLDARLAEEGLADQAMALIGFSQGSMMSLHIAPRRVRPAAAVVAFSGRLLEPERLAAETRVRPPVLLLHGDQDPVVPFEDMALAGDALVKAGFETYGHVMADAGHSISPDGLSAALGFLKARLPG